MGKKSVKPSQIKAPPPPQNEYYYLGNNLQSSRVYDPSKQGYISKVELSPQEQSINDNATSFISNLIGKVPDVFNGDPAQLETQSQEYFAPQQQAIERSYNQALGQAQGAASGNGIQNSVGFNDYLANTLAKNKAQDLSNLEGQRQQFKYQIPSLQLQPYTDAFNLVNSALNGEQARQSNVLQPSFTGSQAASNFQAANYNNLLNYYQAKNNAYAQNRGLLGTLFGR